LLLAATVWSSGRELQDTWGWDLGISSTQHVSHAQPSHNSISSLPCQCLSPLTPEPSCYLDGNSRCLTLGSWGATGSSGERLGCRHDRSTLAGKHKAAWLHGQKRGKETDSQPHDESLGGRAGGDASCLAERCPGTTNPAEARLLKTSLISHQHPPALTILPAISFQLLSVGRGHPSFPLVFS